MGAVAIDEEYHTHKFEYWYCGKCGRRYSCLENICLFCYEKEKPFIPTKYRYIDLPSVNNNLKEYYRSSVNLDDYKE